MLARFSARLLNARASRALATWVETVAMWRWQRATIERCRACMTRRCELSAFARWAEYADERRDMRALIKRVFGRLVNGETAKGWRSWRAADAARDAALREAERTRLLLARFGAKLRNACLLYTSPSPRDRG